MRRRALLSGGNIDYSDCFAMVVTVGGNITWTGSTTSNILSYSRDNGKTWTTANSGTAISVAAGDKVLWKGTPTPQTGKGIGTFSGNTNVRYSVEGNVMSLLFGDDFKGQTSLSGKSYALYRLFYGNKNVTSAENLSLPATTLADSCYRQMFFDCTSLTTAPALPATTLADSCYHYMFYNTKVLPDCTNIDFSSQSVVASGGLNGLFGGTKITTAQLDTILKEHGINNYSLPVTTLANYCYADMFQGCTSLTTAPQLPATSLANYCYYQMFCGCTSLTTAPSTLPAKTLVDNCYHSMFAGCTGLTTAPSLPATTLAKFCYSAMFQGCTSLTTAPSLPATTLADYCYNYMFQGCISLTTAPSTLPATTLAERCCQNMFLGCTSLTTAPELPATTLAKFCYYQMFYGCTKLNSIECLATNISASNCTTNWVNGVAASGTFTKAASMSGWTTGNSGIPSGWTVQTT
jgi:hypothetical protein